jgi:hypothetical protein
MSGIGPAVDRRFASFILVTAPDEIFGTHRLELVRAVLGLVPGPALPGEHDVSELE